MIIRLVKMQFAQEQKSNFVNLFNERKSKIESQDGCHSVRLFNDIKDKNIFFTYSIWDSEDHLNNYRHSDFFRETWSITKPMFDSKAQAWSVVESSMV